MICSVYSECRQELDTYLALISNLNLRYGKTFFYDDRKGFSSKAAFSFLNQTFARTGLSDTEELVLLVGAFSCAPRGNMGRSASLCPVVPGFPPEP